MSSQLLDLSWPLDDDQYGIDPGETQSSYHNAGKNNKKRARRDSEAPIIQRPRRSAKLTSKGKELQEASQAEALAKEILPLTTANLHVPNISKSKTMKSFQAVSQSKPRTLGS